MLNYYIFSFQQWENLSIYAQNQASEVSLHNFLNNTFHIHQYLAFKLKLQFTMSESKMSIEKFNDRWHYWWMFFSRAKLLLFPNETTSEDCRGMMYNIRNLQVFWIKFQCCTGMVLEIMTSAVRPPTVTEKWRLFRLIWKMNSKCCYVINKVAFFTWSILNI